MSGLDGRRNGAGGRRTARCGGLTEHGGGVNVASRGHAAQPLQTAGQPPAPHKPEDGPPMLRARLTTEMKEAMKAGEKGKLATVRMILAALKDKDIEARGLGREPASDDEILALLQKMIKQRTESAAVYDQGGRPELAGNERAEVAIIETFLPRQMDEAETQAAIDAAIAETGAAGPKDMGRVIGVLKGAYAGRMDFGRASGLVKAALNAKG